MAETDPPGNHPKKGGKKLFGMDPKFVYIGGAAAIVVIYIVMKRSSNASAAAATTTTSQTPDPSIDPSTGLPYADENNYGGYSPATESGYLSGTGAYITNGTTNTVSAPSTNAAWAQNVEAYLQSLGQDPTATAAALGKYLTGQTLTSDQNDLVAQALGFYGTPPQGAPAAHVAPPATPTSTAPPARPKGPYRIETTGPGLNSVPEIAAHYHLSTAEVILYNPQFLLNGWNVHGLPSGQQYYLPA